MSAADKPLAARKRAFVLAGGQSSRMGSDKSQLVLGGMTLLERAIDKLRGAGFKVGVAGVRAGVECSAPIVRDNFAACGPLGGMEAALASLAAEPPQPVLFCPVDLPLLPAALLSLLWERNTRTGALVTLPWTNGRPQPLCAIYDSSLAEGIVTFLRAEDRKVMRVMRHLVPAQRFDDLRVEALAPLQSSALSNGADWTQAYHWFNNMNTPADWALLQARFPSSQAPGDTAPHLVSREAR